MCECLCVCVCVLKCLLQGQRNDQLDTFVSSRSFRHRRLVSERNCRRSQSAKGCSRWKNEKKEKKKKSCLGEFLGRPSFKFDQWKEIYCLFAVILPRVLNQSTAAHCVFYAKLNLAWRLKKLNKYNWSLASNSHQAWNPTSPCLTDVKSHKTRSASFLLDPQFKPRIKQAKLKHQRLLFFFFMLLWWELRTFDL